MAHRFCRRPKLALRLLRTSVAMGLVLSLVAPLSPARAQESEPGDSCAGIAGGAFRQSAGDGTIGHILICDGTNWQPLLSHNNDGEATTIGNQSCGTGQVLGYNGTLWGCADADSGIWELQSNVMRPTSGTADFATDDFVFGSYQLGDTGNPDHDVRIFLDKSKGAFRAGSVSSTEWNDANVGVGSVALGANATAIGINSFAWGSRSTARGGNSIVLGYRATIGTDSYNHAFAIGNEARVDAGLAMTISLADQSETASQRPTVSAQGSMGIFMSQADTYNLSGSKVFGVIGGRALIDPAFTQVDVSTGAGGKLALDVEGPIGATSYCDKDGNNCFTAAEVGGDSSLWEEVGGVLRPTSAYPKVALNESVTASGSYSIAWGLYSTANGVNSTAWGEATHAGSYNETALGRYSLNTAGTPGSWVATDTLFEIGNGASSGARANAVTVLKNGNVDIAGNVVAGGTGEFKSSVVIRKDGGGNGVGTATLGIGTADDLASSSITMRAGSHKYATIRNTGSLQLFSGRSTGGINSPLELYAGSTSANTLAMTIIADGKVGIGITDPNVALDVEGDIEYTGSIADVSDGRLKTKIEALPTTSATSVGQLEPVSFEMKDREGVRELGFIAQDVEQVFPELVQESDAGVKSLNYVGLIAPMVKAIQQLQDENAALRARIETLEGSASAPLTQPPSDHHND